MSQRDKVADHLRQHGGITQERALVLYGVQQLRTRIVELRQAGWRIETCTDVYAGTSSPACVGHYVLQQEPGQQPLQPVLPLWGMTDDRTLREALDALLRNAWDRAAAAANAARDGDTTEAATRAGEAADAIQQARAALQPASAPAVATAPAEAGEVEE